MPDELTPEGEEEQAVQTKHWRNKGGTGINQAADERQGLQLIERRLKITQFIAAMSRELHTPHECWRLALPGIAAPTHSR